MSDTTPGPVDEIDEVDEVVDVIDAAADAATVEHETAADDSSVESVLASLESVTAERDEYLRLAQTKQAELENFRKRMMKQQADEVARATGRVIESLLAVLDAFDYAAAHGEESLEPMRDQLLVTLEKQGLSRIVSDGAPFDPTMHDAVAHEPVDDGGGGGDGAFVTETLRAGYLWQGQLLRPAMVKVRG